MAILLLLTSALVAYYVQETFQRQRYLELLELELRQNYIEAGQVMQIYNKSGILLNHTPYSSKVYEAGLQSGYILTLEPVILSSITAYYNTYLPKINDLDTQSWQIMQTYNIEWQKCLIRLIAINKLSDDCTTEEKMKDAAIKTFSKYLAQTAQDMQKNTLEIKFNPTQERLNNPFLSFLMGQKRLKVQE